jgi:N-succinyldiaminopimelate aminotransferase
VAAALDRELYTGLADALQDQRNLFCDGLAELGFDVVRPQGTYFATVDVGRDAVAFCRDLPHRAGVVAIPSSVFYDSGEGDGYVRFAFCKRPEVLAEALRRLKAAEVSR